MDDIPDLEKLFLSGYCNQQNLAQSFHKSYFDICSECLITSIYLLHLRGCSKDFSGLRIAINGQLRHYFFY